MDPVGKQGKIQGNSKDYQKSKLGEQNSWESNAPSDLGGGFNKKSGTREAHDSPLRKLWVGTVKGDTTHTYGVDGKNDPEHGGSYKKVINIKTKGWESSTLT